MKIVRYEQTCTACPSQFDAWDEDGRYYYVRYRWAYLTVNADAVDGELIHGSETPSTDGFDGYMEWPEVCERVGWEWDGVAESPQLW